MICFICFLHYLSLHSVIQLWRFCPFCLNLNLILLLKLKPNWITWVILVLWLNVLTLQMVKIQCGGIWQWQNASFLLHWTSIHKHTLTVWIHTMCLVYLPCAHVHHFNCFFFFFYHRRTCVFKNCVYFKMYFILSEHLIRACQLRGDKQLQSSERVTCFHRDSVSPCQLLPISNGILHWLHRVKAPRPAPPSPLLSLFSRSSAAKIPLLSPSSWAHMWFGSSVESNVCSPPPTAAAKPVIGSNHWVSPDSGNHRNTLHALHHSSSFTGLSQTLDFTNRMKPWNDLLLEIQNVVNYRILINVRERYGDMGTEITFFTSFLSKIDPFSLLPLCFVEICLCHI